VGAVLWIIDRTTKYASTFTFLRLKFSVFENNVYFFKYTY